MIKKTALAIILFVFINNNVSASNYYFSSLMGSDSHTSFQAQSQLTPWRTIDKLNSFVDSLVPGDSVLFRRGEVFYGTMVITSSGTQGSHLVFSAYGQGSMPVISGFTALNGWVNTSPNIWEADCPSCGTKVNQLVINDQPHAMGRYPNRNTINKGYLTFESSTISSITDNELQAAPDWTGADVVIRSHRWIIDRLPIVQHAVNTLTYSGSTAYNLGNDWGYFIQNSPLTLDEHGEWFYDPHTHKVKLYTNASSPSALAIEVTTLNSLLSLNSQSYLTFEYLEFKGSNLVTISASDLESVYFENCAVDYSGENGVLVLGTNHDVRFEKSTINHTNNNAIEFKGATNSIIRDNTIKNTAIMEGMGKNANGTYQAVGVKGANNLIEYNTVDSTGYLGIRFIGDSTVIKNNFVINYCFVKDDGAGIYCWMGDGCDTITSNSMRGSQIIGNIVLNGLGAEEGTNNSDYKPAYGIYLDDNSQDVLLVDNTVANNVAGGIYFHNAHNIEMLKNTSFNNSKEQLVFSSGTCPNGLIENNLIYNNILFSKYSNQFLINAKSSASQIALYGELDSNYFYSPDESTVIIKDYSKTYNLQDWQRSYLHDLTSEKAPVSIPDYTFNNLLGSNQFVNGSFDSDISGASCWSASGSSCLAAYDSTGQLDGGALEFSFLSTSGTTEESFVYMNIGAVDSSKNYILRFSLKGTKNNQSLRAYVRKYQSPYTALTPIQYFDLSTSRTENEFLFSFPKTESSALIIIKVEEADSTFWIDNVEFYEADVIVEDPDDHILFEYNATKSLKTIVLSESYVDIKGNYYSGSVTLQPFTSIILIKQESAEILESIKNDIGLFAYPNPTNDYLNVEVREQIKSRSTLSLFNLAGQTLLSKKLNKGFQKITINIEDIPAGIYFLNIEGEGVNRLKKIIVY